MKVEIKNPVIAKTLKALALYVVAGLICFILELIMPSNSHTPGLGYVGLFLLMIVSGVLFFINLLKFLNGDKSRILPLVIDLSVSISLAYFFFAILQI